MGGSYYTPTTPPRPSWEGKLREALDQNNRKALIESYRSYFSSEGKESGFIGNAMKLLCGKSVKNFPKEFSDIEYEVKFNIDLAGDSTQQLSLCDYLDMFDFPVVTSSRFLKDPLNTTSEGFNHYFGTNTAERLVVIDKMGKGYMKEKGESLPIDINLSHKDIVTKRREVLLPATLSEIIERIHQVTRESGVHYRGKIKKERADMFLLNAHDGRIYNFTVTRAQITRSEQQVETQRQLEIEYAGYLPGFKNFKNEDEQQLIRSMLDLTRYTYALYHDVLLPDEGRMKLVPTKERKYDFVLGTSSLRAPSNSHMEGLELFNTHALPDKRTDIMIEEVAPLLR